AYGIRINYVNRNGKLNDANIAIRDNVIKAIAKTGEAGYRASALDFDSLDPGIGLMVTNNVLESNDVSLQLAGSDGQALNNLDVISSTMRKSDEGAGRPYTGILAGFWIDTIKAVRVIDARIAPGANSNVVFSGQGTKELCVCDFLTVAVRGRTG